MMEVHPHEDSKEYFMAGPFRRGNDSEEQWEPCRILTKFTVLRASGRGDMYCTVECRMRPDLDDTVPFRPTLPIK